MFLHPGHAPRPQQRRHAELIAEIAHATPRRRIHRMTGSVQTGECVASSWPNGDLPSQPCSPAWTANPRRPVPLRYRDPPRHPECHRHGLPHRRRRESSDPHPFSRCAGAPRPALWLSLPFAFGCSGAGACGTAECRAMLQRCFHCWSAVCHSAIAVEGRAYPGAFSGSLPGFESAQLLPQQVDLPGLAVR